MATALAPRQSSATQQSYRFDSGGGTVAASTVPQLPKGEGNLTLLDFKFDFNAFPLLYDAIDALPGFSKSTYDSVDLQGNPIKVPQIHFESPSVAGFKAEADFRVDLAAKVALEYKLDLGQFTFNAVAVSALRLEDRDPQDGTQPPNDPDADLYTNLTIDTALAGITVSAQSNAAKTDSTAKLKVDIAANVGAFNAGFLGDLLSLSGKYDTSIELFKGRPGDTAAAFTTDLLKGFINVPSLPSTLSTQAGGTGQALFAPSSDTEDGPIFANITFDPIPLIPGLGAINKGAFYPIRTPLLDVGVEWKLITLDFGANLSLRQSIDVSIKSVKVAIEVDEKNFDTNDHKLARDAVGNITGNGTALTGQLGDKFSVNFSTGDQQNTKITETYFITAHVKTDISLIPTLSLDLRLMDFSLIINPILIDQFKYDFNLFNHRFDYEIGAIKLVEDGFDVTFRPVSVTTQVDTHLRVDGTEFDDRDDPNNMADVGADGVWHKALFLAGNQPDVDGLAGDDIIKGRNIDSVLAGGAGNDLIDGSSGTDKVSYAAALAGVSVSLAIAGAQVTVGAGTDTLLGIENVTGSAFDDRLSGNNGNNTLNGLGGLDRMAGGLGDDTYFVDSSVDIVLETLEAGLDKVFASASWAIAGQSIETLELTGTANITAGGNQFANTLIGNSGNNILTALGGNDLLDGGAGNDTLDGGADNDTARYARVASGVTVSLALTGAQVTGGAGTDTLIGIENLTGSAFSDTLTGNGESNVLNGLGGIDTMAGGAGDDTYYVDNTSDAVVEAARQGTDKVFASASWSIAGQSIEALELIGTANLAATGDGFANTLIGNSGMNLLTGLGGNDVLDGGAGDDTLDGGGDSDTASYARAASSVTVSLAIAGAQATGAAGTDTLVSIENLTGSAFADTLTGNAGNNLIDGLGGIDTMDGGRGDDTYTVDNTGDVVIENLRSGTDTVLASVSYTLTGGFIEQLGLIGTDNITATGDIGSNFLAGNTGNNLLTGNGGADTLAGGAGVDRLDGGEGDDLLIGGAGVDVLTGGSGRDRFQFGAAIAANADRVTDFEVNVDKLIFTAADYGQPIGDFDIQSFTEGSSAVGSQAQFVYNSAARTLSWDADGDGAGSAVLIATFDTAVALTSFDIVMA